MNSGEEVLRGKATEHGARKMDEPWRRCIVTRSVLPKSQMVRFALAPCKQIVPDLAGRLPGRGWWMECKKSLLEQAIRHRLFARATGHAVSVDDDLPRQLSELLKRRCLSWISLARRAGILVSGYQSVREVLATGRVKRSGLALQLLVTAQDCSQAQSSHLRRLARSLTTISCFESRSLGQALGRESLHYLAMGQGRLAVCFISDCERFSSFSEIGNSADQLPASDFSHIDRSL